MHFCVISPIKGLNLFSILSPVHLVLPFIKNKEYIEFYRHRRTMEELLILDNGAYEGNLVRMSRLVKMIQTYNPQVVVLPDLLLQPWKKTLEVIERTLVEYGPELQGRELMAVPQAEAGHPNDWYKCLDEILKMKEISWIGLPRALPLEIACDPRARVDAIPHIKAKRPDMKIHCLGMARGCVTELKTLRLLNVESVDSSAPVWRGWNGYTLFSPHWPEYPCDFETERPLNQAELELITYNLEVCGVGTLRSE